MNVSDTLNKAADLIEARGWRTDVDGWGESGSGPLCIEGAIAAAAGARPDDAVDMANTCPAGLAVRNYLNLPAYRLDAPADIRLPLWWWNDGINHGHRRTATEVVEVLRATALIEAARERETTAVTR